MMKERLQENEFFDLSDQLVRQLNLVDQGTVEDFIQVIKRAGPRQAYARLAAEMSQRATYNEASSSELRRMREIMEAVEPEGWDAQTHRLLAQRIGAFAHFQGWGGTDELEQIFWTVIDLF